MSLLAIPNKRVQHLYDESQIQTRNSVEQQIDIWKMRFLLLRYELCCKIYTSLSIIVATEVMQNITRDMNEELPPALNS